MKIFTLPLRATKSACLFVLLVFAGHFSKAQTNYAIDLNGTDAYADLGNVSPTDNFTNGLTIECWVKWDAFNSWSRLADLGNGPANNNIIFANEATSSKLRFEVYQNGTTQGITSPISLTTGRWYHVAVTQTNTGVATIYIDGAVATTGIVQMPLNVSRSQCYIGRSSWTGDAWLDGKVDEMRIWNIARTQAEIRKSMIGTVPANTTGLVAYYHFNEGSGTRMVNTCTNGFAVDAASGGGLAWGTSPAQYANNALHFDGTDDYISIGSVLPSASSYTKEAWVYLTKNTFTPQHLISSNGSPFWVDGGTLKAGNSALTPVVSDPSNIPPFTWVHVAVTYDATTGAMRLYRDGNLVSSATTFNNYVAANNYIGANFNGTGTDSYVGGRIDEVRIWNVARTQSEIQNYINRELNAANQPNLVAYYSFNQANASGDNTGVVTIPDLKAGFNGTLNNFALTGATSNFIGQKAGMTLLPVHIESFTAQKDGNMVQLDWATTAEDNSLQFVVEHSLDAQSWTALGNIAASGTTDVEKRYNFLHATPAIGSTNYYRLREEDIDGRITYSEIRSVFYAEKRNSFTINNNILTSNLLDLQVNNEMVMSLYASDGRLLWSKKLHAGRQTISLANFAKGMYYLNAGEVTKRIVLQ